MNEQKCYSCGAELKPNTPFCPECNERIEWIKVCSNCHNTWIRGDRYCRYCGAPMGTPVFIQDTRGYLYGPMPMKRTHVCSQCGYTWTRTLMVDNEEYCPLCGQPAPVVCEEDDWRPITG